MKDIIKLLQSREWRGTEIIDIAKGKYELPKTLKGWIRKIKNNN